MTPALLLDTHAFLWLMTDDERVPGATRDLVQATHEVYVSAATAWEIRTKFRLGKLPDAAPFVADLEAEVTRNGFSALPISLADGAHAGAFSVDHKDPFDRMLAAQAINHRLAVVSNDAALDAFGVVRVW